MMIYLIVISCIVLVLLYFLINKETFNATTITTTSMNNLDINNLDINKIDTNNDIIFSDKNILNNNIELFFKTYYTIIDIDEFNTILKNDFNTDETFNSIYANYKWSRHNLLELVDILYFSYDNLDNNVLKLKALGDFVRLNCYEFINTNFFLINEDYKTTEDIFIYYNNELSINNLADLKDANKNGEEEFNKYLFSHWSKPINYNDTFNKCFSTNADGNKTLCKSNINVIQNEYLGRSIANLSSISDIFLKTLDDLKLKLKSNNKLIKDLYKYYTLMVLIKFSKIKSYNTYRSHNNRNYYSRIINQCDEACLEQNRHVYTTDDLVYLNEVKEDLIKLKQDAKYMNIINTLNDINFQLENLELAVSGEINDLKNEEDDIKNIINNIK
jgi:hypothetical protein